MVRPILYADTTNEPNEKADEEAEPSSSEVDSSDEEIDMEKPLGINA